MEGSQCLCRASHIHLCPHSCALGCAACPQNTWRQKRPGVTEGDEVHSQNRKSQTGLRVSHCLGLPCTLFRVWDEGTVSGPARHFPLGIHLSCLRDMNSRGSPDPLCSPQFTAPQHGAGPHEHLALVRMNSWVWKEKPPGQENSCLSFPDLHTGGWAQTQTSCCKLPGQRHLLESPGSAPGGNIPQELGTKGPHAWGPIAVLFTPR